MLTVVFQHFGHVQRQHPIRSFDPIGIYGLDVPIFDGYDDDIGVPD